MMVFTIGAVLSVCVPCAQAEQGLKNENMLLAIVNLEFSLIHVLLDVCQSDTCQCRIDVDAMRLQ